MSRCVQCGYNNLPDAIVCAHCYAVLRVDEPSGFSTTFPVFNLSTNRELSRPPRVNVQLDKLDKRTIVLYVEKSPDPIIMRVIQTAFLGRASENFKVHPLLDLTPFGGVDAGVSRVHAAIYRTVSGMAIEDRASSNGTWLNGTRLEPRRFYPLASGDHLFFSKLSVEIYIGQADIFTQVQLDPNDVAERPSPVSATPSPTVSENKMLPSGAEVPTDPTHAEVPKSPTLEGQAVGK